MRDQQSRNGIPGQRKHRQRLLRRTAALPPLILSLAAVAHVTAAARLAAAPSIQKTGKRVTAASAKGWGRKRALYPVESVPGGVAVQVRGGSRDEDDEGVTEVGRRWLLNELRTAAVSSCRCHLYILIYSYVYGIGLRVPDLRA